ncbi:Carboxyl-terminal-processing protease [Galdieria sulphuraria]|nr:Carboxyl-terminal-processing protease [Galdieria sulphuraria]
MAQSHSRKRMDELMKWRRERLSYSSFSPIFVSLSCVVTCCNHISFHCTKYKNVTPSRIKLPTTIITCSQRHSTPSQQFHQVTCKLLSSVGAVIVFLCVVPLTWSLTEEQSWVLRQVNSNNAHFLIKDMLSTLHDPYTRLLEPEEYQSLQATATGQLTGIGIQMAPQIENDKVLITYVYPQSPAALADIRTKDAIIAIDHFSVSQAKNVEQVAMHIRGEKDTLVHMILERNGQRLSKTIRRQDYVLKTVESNIFKPFSASQQIGYLRIRSFDFHTVDQVKEVLTNWKRQHIECLILDLRDNAGGYFPAGIGVASLFLPHDKVIVYTVDYRGIEETYKSTQPGIFIDGCVVILVNENTASASELVTAALHEQRGSLILGHKTFGKGVVQRVFPLSDGSAIAVTTMKYLTPNHIDIHRKGIDVDIPTSCKVDNSLECSPPVSYQLWCLSICPIR